MDGASDDFSGRRVKGKQVQILCDLVTVFGEFAAIYVTDNLLGRQPQTMIHESGNLPFAVHENVPVTFSDHEVLIVRNADSLFEGGLVCCAFFPIRGLF